MNNIIINCKLFTNKRMTQYKVNIFIKETCFDIFFCKLLY